MQNWQRTHLCNELTVKDENKEIILNGWVHRIRNHGGIFFISLRDSYGITQIYIDAEDLKDVASQLRNEYCIAVQGLVTLRPEAMINSTMPTGAIELKATNIRILSESKPLPFNIEEESNAGDSTRLEYRYLDLRSFGMQERIKLRSATTFAIREYMHNAQFLELETPTLVKSTPEGARDFLVPSRINKGHFYALPQSPQIYKQLSMVGGLDKYYQIARCYRDEDARGDRQPEFTQLDLEMSFPKQDDILKLIEGLLGHVFKKIKGINLEKTFDRLTYQDAMELYGSDKPDLRFDMSFKDFTSIARKSEFQVFKTTLEEKGFIKALVVKNAGDQFSRKRIEELEALAKVYKAKGLPWFKCTAEGLEGGISKFLTGLESEIKTLLGLEANDLVLLGVGNFKVCHNALGAIRQKLGKELNLYDKDSFKFAWIIDFPVFEWDEDNAKWEPAHHMFTMPKPEYLDTFVNDPGPVKGQLYDLVMNGYELGSGSIRVHDAAIQSKIFEVIGFPREEALKRFGFMLNAFEYGPPPHGGIALGLDRLVMLLAGQESLKEVILFPKNNQAYSPMDESPTPVDEAQLKELSLALRIES